MLEVISIDPGHSKCGLVMADLKNKKVYEAIVIKSNLLVNYVKKQYQEENKIKLLIGNGTSSKAFREDLKDLFPNLIIVEEKNTTFRSKQRYFEIFPVKGLKCFLPKDLLILNKNLDAIAALIIMEDYFECRFDLGKAIGTKTWLK